MTTLTYSLLALGVCAVIFYWLRSLIVLCLCVMLAALGLVLVPEASLLKQVVVEKLLQFGGPGLPASTRNWLAQRLPPAQEPGLTMPDDALTQAGMARSGLGSPAAGTGMMAATSPPAQGKAGIPAAVPNPPRNARDTRSPNGTGIRYLEDENRARNVLNGTSLPAPRATAGHAGSPRASRPLPEGFDSEAPAPAGSMTGSSPSPGKMAPASAKIPATPAARTEKPAPAPASAAGTDKAGEKSADKAAEPPRKQEWIVQLGVFSDAQNAEKLRTEVGDSLGGNIPVRSQTLHTDRGEQVRVLAGPFANRNEANKVQGMLKAMQINAVVKARS